ncbi:MAG TPA: hypothetical protein VFG20_01150 [Planctomycetaceae bacterium]|nr:hypothetical protein [Planctomycetaceae bacterium]
MVIDCRHLLCLSLVVLGTGCSHLFESRAINRFSENLQKEDIKGLKDASTEEFAEKALRTASALEDIKILRVPDGKITVVDVEDIDKDRRRVTVKVGEAKKEVFYELVRDYANRWVVDDIYLKQKKTGVVAYKSVTEQMNLLLTVREFLDSWDGGERDQILAATAPELSATLERLPPTYLAHLTTRIVGSRGEKSTFKPQAQLEEETAVVRLPRQGGEAVLSLKLKGEKWMVTDVALDTKDESQRIPSLHKLALAVTSCTDFLAAYQKNDKTELEILCDRDFYQGSLKVADLGQVILPAPTLPDHELEVQLRSQRADFILRGEHEVVQIDLRREDSPEPMAPPTFRVCDVTIYEIESKQEKRLSALFTSKDMLELFCEALAERDLDHLRHSTTQDFSNRVWRRLNNATVVGLPLEVFDDAKPEVISTTFQGSLTRVETRQSGQPVTYLLREENGRFYVDDIQWQITGRPASVKQTLDLMIPMKNFAASIALGRDPAEQKTVLEMLQQTCSSDFNRMVWQQTPFVPNSGLSADTFLNAPLRSIVQSENETIIRVGDESYGAEVQLRKENQRFVVDEIRLIAGVAESERIDVKHTLRNLLAQGRAVKPEGPESELRIVERPKAPAKIQSAVYEEVDDPEVPPLREILQTNDVIDTAPPRKLP